MLVTDIWVSLGQEAESERRLRDLEPYRLDEALLAEASDDAIVPVQPSMQEPVQPSMHDPVQPL